MADDFVPRREAELLTWAGAFDARINADPGAAGLDFSQANQFHLDYLAFVASHAAANDPVTRSPVNVASKNRLLGRLIFSIRQLSAIAPRFPAMTNPMRIALGLPPRSGTLTPIAAPSTAPLIVVKTVILLSFLALVTRSQFRSRQRPLCRNSHLLRVIHATGRQQKGDGF